MRLRFARWEATRPPRRGTVCVFHGRGEFIEKYFEVVADLRRRGFAVATMDWRGQGGSAHMLRNPNKGYVRSWLGPTTGERGGRARRFFALRPAGVRELESSRRALEQMWRGLDWKPRVEGA
jgi:hypothetical protein